MPHKVGNGAILGIVSEDGVPSQKRITLMDRSDLSIVQRSASDIYGAYAFTGLNPDTDDYLIFTVDDDGVEKKAAIIYDYVKPIPAHQGGFYWANWYRLSMMKEPIVSIIPISAIAGTTTGDLSYGAGKYPPLIFGLSTTYNQQSITPAAQNIPTVSFSSSGIRKTTLDNNALISNPSQTNISFEWVLDLSKPLSSRVSLMIFSASGETGVGNTYNSFNYKSIIIAVDYTAATNTVSIRKSPGTGYTPQYNENVDATAVSVLSYVLPESIRNKAIHISGSISFASIANLFINGALAKTASLVGTGATYDRRTANHIGLMTLGSTYIPSQSIDTNTATLTSSLAAIYAETMTEQESLALYQSLFFDAKPGVTGYLKSVLEDYPLYFYRLQDIAESTKAIDALRPNNKAGNPSALSKGVYSGVTNSSDTIVVGGSGKVFSGGGYAASDLPGALPSSTAATIEFIAKPTAGQTGTQVILSHRRSTEVYFEVQIVGSALKPRLVWQELGSIVNISFNTSLSTAAINHYAFSINKLAGTVQLFVNSVLTETVVTTAHLFDIPRISTVATAEGIYIAGILSSNLTSISNPYYGYLSEVALYPAALSQAVIKKHYDARLTL